MRTSALSHGGEIFVQEGSGGVDKAEVADGGNYDRALIAVLFDFLAAHRYKMLYPILLHQSAEFQDSSVRNPDSKPLYLLVVFHNLWRWADYSPSSTILNTIDKSLIFIYLPPLYVYYNLLEYISYCV